MPDGEDITGDLIEEAAMDLRVAEELIMGGRPGEAISTSFLAMLHAAGAALGKGYAGISAWEEVVDAFVREALPVLALSKENQRALIIVGDLYRRVQITGQMEADPVTASACLDDARSFVEEIGDKLGESGG